MRLVLSLAFCTIAWWAMTQGPAAAAVEAPAHRSLDELLPDAAGAAQLTLELRRSDLLQRALAQTAVRCDERFDVDSLAPPLRDAVRRLDAALPDLPDCPKSAPQVWLGTLLDGCRVGLVRWHLGTSHALGLLHQDLVTGVVASASFEPLGCFDSWYELPRLQQADLDGDGSMELVFDVHYHAGTCLDSDERHYLVPRGGGFRSILTLTTGVSHADSPGECGQTHQLVLAQSARRLRVYSWYDNPCVGPDHVPLGVTQLEREDLDQPFREVSRTAWLRGAERYLQTPEPSYTCLR